MVAQSSFKADLKAVEGAAGVPDVLADHLTALVLSLVALSIVAHGVSVTPVMKRYEGRT